MTAYALDAGPIRLTTYQPQSPTGSMDQSIPSDRSSAGPVDVEVRRIVNMMCNIKPRDDAQNDFMVNLLLLCIIMHYTNGFQPLSNPDAQFFNFLYCDHIKELIIEHKYFF